MKVEYVCMVTLDERDVRLAAANGGTTIDHPIPPIRTIFRLSNEAQKQLAPEGGDAERPA